jgi:hypothetical protein
VPRWASATLSSSPRRSVPENDALPAPCGSPLPNRGKSACHRCEATPLMALDPSNVTWQNDLSVSRNMVARLRKT